MVLETTESSLTSDPLEVRGLTIKKGHLNILERISFTLETGTFVGLIGPSGCGKTSLLRVLAFLDSPLQGEICFSGDEPKRRDGTLWLAAHHFYPRVTYVPQTLALWPHMDVRENMLFATTTSLDVLTKLESLCERLEISDVLDRRPAFVSQGQRQRCALVRALLLEPALLFLDEVTAALDEKLARKVWDLLCEFTSGGGTIFASTHSGRLASACDYYFQIRERSLEPMFTKHK